MPEGEQADPIELALEDQSGPANRSCVSVDAIGSTQSGKWLPTVKHHFPPPPADASVPS
jgi:hypothetical protein